MKKYKIFIGYDSREKLAYDVARRSILCRASNPKQVQVLPLEIDSDKITSILKRPIEWRGNQLWCPISEAPMATEFAISRFCVPFLTKGWALFVDCDIVCLDDIENLFKLADDQYAVMVVKHRHEDGGLVKMGDQSQTYYNRKNWSSVILWNCDHPANKKLTVELLNNLPGRDLHRFCWLKDEEIGELPVQWNYLIGVTQERCKIKLAHYTLGGPWIKDWKINDAQDDSIWLEEVKHFKL